MSSAREPHVDRAERSAALPPGPIDLTPIGWARRGATPAGRGAEGRSRRVSPAIVGSCVRGAYWCTSGSPSRERQGRSGRPGGSQPADQNRVASRNRRSLVVRSGSIGTRLAMSAQPQPFDQATRPDLAMQAASRGSGGSASRPRGSRRGRPPVPRRGAKRPRGGGETRSSRPPQRNRRRECSLIPGLSGWDGGLSVGRGRPVGNDSIVRWRRTHSSIPHENRDNAIRPPPYPRTGPSSRGTRAGRAPRD
jgi:hypothetical protein